MRCYIAITTLSRELIRDAKKYLQDNETCKIGFAVPIILSHMALEMQVSSMERFFLRREGFNNDEIEALLHQNVNIANRKKNDLSKARLLFKLVIKEIIPNEIDLDELNKINCLRNKAIHRGSNISREEAEKAVDIVEKTLGLLETMFAKLARPKKPI